MANTTEAGSNYGGLHERLLLQPGVLDQRSHIRWHASRPYGVVICILNFTGEQRMNILVLGDPKIDRTKCWQPEQYVYLNGQPHVYTTMPESKELLVHLRGRLRAQTTEKLRELGYSVYMPKVVRR